MKLRFLFISESGPRKKWSIGYNPLYFSFLQNLYVDLTHFHTMFPKHFLLYCWKGYNFETICSAQLCKSIVFHWLFSATEISAFVFLPLDKGLGNVWQRIFVKMMTSTAWCSSTSQLLSIKLSSDITDNENLRSISHSLPKEKLHLLKHSEPSSLTNQRVHPDTFQMSAVIWHWDIWGKGDILILHKLLRKFRVKDKRDTYVKTVIKSRITSQ